MHHTHILLLALRRDERALRRALLVIDSVTAAVAAAVAVAVTVRCHDVPPAVRLLEPAVLDQGLGCQQSAEDDREEDEEDACPRVGACVGGHPLSGVERCCVGVVEDRVRVAHGVVHVHVHASAATAHTVVHAAAVVVHIALGRLSAV